MAWQKLKSKMLNPSHSGRLIIYIPHEMCKDWSELMFHTYYKIANGFLSRTKSIAVKGQKIFHGEVWNFDGGVCQWKSNKSQVSWMIFKKRTRSGDAMGTEHQLEQSSSRFGGRSLQWKTSLYSIIFNCILMHINSLICLGSERLNICLYLQSRNKSIELGMIGLIRCSWRPLRFDSMRSFFASLSTVFGNTFLFFLCFHI